MTLRSRARLVGFCVVLGLGACDTGPTGEPGGQEPDQGFRVGNWSDPCGANPFQGLVGQNAAALNSSALPGDARILYPDMTPQGQFQNDRITVTVDGANTVTGVACG